MKLVLKKNIILLSLALYLFLNIPSTFARIIFVDDVFENNSETYEIGSNDDANSTNIKLDFGGLNSESIYWDTNAFNFTNNISLNDNKIVDAEIENVSALPGGAAGLGGAGSGRIVLLDTLDSTAPSCTTTPFCAAGTYVWDGGGWISLTGSTSSTLTKVVTVGSTGADYLDIDTAANYLKNRSGGIMLLSAETHVISTAVDLTNVTLIGKDANKTTIEISGSGQIDAFDTHFSYLTIDINSMTDNTAIDVQPGSSSLQFEWVDFNVQDSGDSLIDSNAGTAPITTLTFINCNETGGAGVILKTIADGNIDVASSVFISSASGDTLLQLGDWNTTIEGSGNVYTTGTITTIPNNTIYVYPGMYIQGAIDSLPNGGSITLLPGIHAINSTLLIDNDSIEISGYGDSSIISASSFSGSDTTAAIQIGAVDGSAPVNGVSLRSFKLEVSGTGASDIHGIRVTGGEDNKVDNITVEKVSGASGSGSTARIGIQFLDGASGCSGTCVLTRPVITNSRVFGNSTTGSYFTDGIHVSSDGALSGVWGYGQGIINALVDSNNVDYLRETGYVFIGVDDSSLFNNRASRTGISGGYGIFMGHLTNINMNANVFSNSLDPNSIAIGIDGYGTTSTVDSIFNNNIIDGISNGGVGFVTGFQIGGTSSFASRNSFQNNTIRGASSGTTTAIVIRGNCDDNTFSGNNIVGGTNAWDRAIDLQASTQERNIIRANHYTNVTLPINNTGTYTKIGVAHHRSTSNPTVNDDSGDDYAVGTVWINTSTNNAWILTDDTLGSAVWVSITSTGGSASIPDKIQDADTNTKIQVEESANDDTIRFDFGGGTAINDALTMNQNNGFIWNINNDNLDFRLDASTITHLLFLDASANRIGIGSSSPDSMLNIENLTTSTDSVFHLENFGTGDSLVVDDVNGDTSPFVIDASGNVGIGLTTPNNKLDIQASGQALELGDASANDINVNFDDGTDRLFGWDDNYSTNHTSGTFSTNNNEIALRILQGSNTPLSCDASHSGMQWMDTDTGLLYICDTSNSRNKWLSVSEMSLFGDESGTCNAGQDPNSNANCNVDWGNGLGPDGNTDLGLYIPHNITITGYGFSEDNDACTSGSFDVEVWGTGSNTDDNNYTLSAEVATALTGQAHNASNLNIDINGDQYILWGIDNNCGQSMDDWNVILYFRYRHD